jgi:hypothetical protein
VRLEINTSGSWKIICRDIPADQVDEVRNACEVLVNLAEPKLVAFRLCNRVGNDGVWYAADMLRRLHGHSAQWDSRK